MIDILDVVERDGERVALRSYQLLRLFEILGFFIDEPTSFQEVLEEFLDALAHGVFDLRRLISILEG